MTSEPLAAVWDAHAHVIGDSDAFPFWPGRGYTPAPASLDAYLSMLDRYGIAHGVLVQPSVYAFDNSCLLDAVDRAHGRLFGIVVPPPDATPGDLEAMHRRGARGVRCNWFNPGGLPPNIVAAWQPVLRELGWHVELHVSLAHHASVAALVRHFDVPVVIDHMGRPAPEHASPESPRMRELIALVRDAACFVKLSAPYRITATPGPWPELTPLAQAFVQANAQACLWGSDWPHVDTAASVDSDAVFHTLAIWCPDATTRRIVATHSARTLFVGG